MTTNNSKTNTNNTKIHSDSDNAILHIRLSPGASASGVRGWMNDENGTPVLKVGVTAIAESGKANAALIQLLSKLAKHPKSSIKIRSGLTDRNKTVCFHALPQSELLARLPQ